MSESTGTRAQGNSMGLCSQCAHWVSLGTLAQAGEQHNCEACDTPTSNGADLLCPRHAIDLRICANCADELTNQDLQLEANQRRPDLAQMPEVFTGFMSEHGHNPNIIGVSTALDMQERPYLRVTVLEVLDPSKLPITYGYGGRQVSVMVVLMGGTVPTTSENMAGMKRIITEYSNDSRQFEQFLAANRTDLLFARLAEHFRF